MQIRTLNHHKRYVIIGVEVEDGLGSARTRVTIGEFRVLALENNDLGKHVSLYLKVSGLAAY